MYISRVLLTKARVPAIIEHLVVDATDEQITVGFEGVRVKVKVITRSDM